MMISIDQLLQWRQEYEDIYQMQVLDQQFILRPIGREEYKQIMFLDLNLGQMQEAICHQCVVHPIDYDYSVGPAGVAEVLFDSILEISGLHVNQASEILDSYREEMLNFDYQADCLIHEAFPEYSIEEISGWSIRKTMYYLSRSEWVLQNLKNIYLPYIEETAAIREMREQGEAPPPPPDIPKAPPQREIRSELVEAPTKDVQQEVKKEAPPPPGGIQTEAELLAMLAGTGAAVAKPSTVIDDIKPELNWFNYMDELKGDFD